MTVNRKFLPYIIGLFLLVFTWKAFEFSKDEEFRTERKGKNSPVTTLENQPAEIDRSLTKLIYTKHARCRMGCRHVEEREIKEILKEGKINYQKSGPSKKGGYEFALEGKSGDGQNLRVVFAQENNQLVVITCIDLEHDWACDCPGDEHKN